MEHKDKPAGEQQPTHPSSPTINSSVQQEHPLKDSQGDITIASERVTIRWNEDVKKPKSTEQEAFLRTVEFSDERTVFTPNPKLEATGELISWELDADEWERYVVECKLGEGGMGIVYQAVDQKLQRKVALKFILEDDPRLARRLVWEAQAQARIHHEFVCKVYEVGEYKGRPYIAMQYIEGDNLDDALDELGIPLKVELIEKVAHAIHSAHQEGVIHRDIKPSNIMVSTVSGRLKPFIMDFGLAREVATNGATATNTLVGTPHFMSPEQMRGETHLLDRHTDIYSLGATLYALLAGHPPFPTTGMDILFKVLHEEPVPLRKINASIPLDLETIVMKCLEKDPARRYPSAQALADDLRHFLDGEPIKARPASLSYRFKKYLRKHKRLAIAGMVGLSIVMALIGWGIKTQLDSSAKAALANQFGQQVKEVESIMRYAHMLPLHNVTTERTLVQMRLDKIKKQLKSLSRSNRGPGYHALGMGSMALGDFQRSKTYLDKAWKYGARGPEVAQALGKLWGRLYQTQLEALERIKRPDKRKKRRKFVEKFYRKQALFYLQRGFQRSKKGGTLLEARIAYYDKQWSRVRKIATKIFNKQPWRYEALMLIGRISSQESRKWYYRGKYQKAYQKAQEATRIYRRAVKIGRSDAQIYTALCGELTTMMKINFSTGRPLEEISLTAQKACQNALKADPHRIDPYRSVAYFHQVRGQHLMYSGQDPTPETSKAIKIAQQAKRMAPNSPDVDETLGLAHFTNAEYHLFRRMDPKEQSNKAIQHYQEAIKQHTKPARMLNALGTMYWTRAYYTLLQDEDPRPLIEKGLRAQQAALKLEANDSNVHYNTGMLWFAKARFEVARSLPAHKSMKEVEFHYNKALQLTPKNAFIQNGMGYLHWLKAVYQHGLGKDPTAELNIAERHLLAGYNLNPSLPFLYHGFGRVYWLKAEYARQHGRSPLPYLKQAILKLHQGTQVKADYVDLYIWVAKTLMLWAQHQLEFDQSPMENIQKIRHILELLGQINKNLGESHLLNAQLQLILARWKVFKGDTPHHALTQARMSLVKASKKLHNHADIFLTRAYIRLWQTHWLLAQNHIRAAQEAIKRGLIALKKSKERRPQLAIYTGLEGVFLALRSQSYLSSNQGKTDASRSKKLIDKALKQDPNIRRDLLRLLPSKS
ncbi:MAG TPA: hypothetical protein DCE42_25685 [Myxococcales bacterium]|nr:hypothetical protein [Deltaproteobacteria bacterium]MBU53806.1 hypothetical protein [Deltaproteobacteria bacterium]HAA58181.1 hypothetical protein [Myxococcales bacterium]|tara:strand:+ start:6362 stop:9850 length:3489 start_codon:yes stop_codon:yes gene_type:complete